jgi:cytochrome c oxidase subunit 4
MAEPPVTHAQPGPATWVRVLVLLTIATVLEVLTYVFESTLGVLTVPILILFAIIKFLLVVAYYMHLKYDARLLTGIFTWGMVIALSIFMAMAGNLPYLWPTSFDAIAFLSTRDDLPGSGHDGTIWPEYRVQSFIRATLRGDEELLFRPNEGGVTGPWKTRRCTWRWARQPSRSSMGPS